MRTIAARFKALSDPNRIRIVKMLESRPLCVCEIQSALGLAVSTVSKHLSVLREAGFILDSKEGRWVTYRLNESGGDAFIRELLAFLRKNNFDDPVFSEDRKKLEKADRFIICGTGGDQ